MWQTGQKGRWEGNKGRARAAGFAEGQDGSIEIKEGEIMITMRIASRIGSRGGEAKGKGWTLMPLPLRSMRVEMLLWEEPMVEEGALAQGKRVAGLERALAPV